VAPSPIFSRSKLETERFRVAEKDRALPVVLVEGVTGSSSVAYSLRDCADLPGAAGNSKHRTSVRKVPKVAEFRLNQRPSLSPSFLPPYRH
jgi:hypothetical protein